MTFAVSLEKPAACKLESLIPAVQSRIRARLAYLSDRFTRYPDEAVRFHQRGITVISVGFTRLKFRVEIEERTILVVELTVSSAWMARRGKSF